MCRAPSGAGRKPLPHGGAGLAVHGRMTAAEQLADARRKLGLSLDDISSRTNISIKRLSAIERADPEGLPSFVSLEGCIRAYATEVKLDPDAISDRYISQLLDPSSLMSPENSVDGYIIPAIADAFAEFESEDDRADDMPPPSVSGVVFVPPVESRRGLVRRSCASSGRC
jgi:transcriptional regulator with XRE-family HTH domain